jgi:PAS domain S-box-containing protein
MNVNRGLSLETVWQSDLKFRLLVENVKDYAILMLDPRGMVRSWNAGAEDMKQYKAFEILGEHVSKFYLPEDIAVGKPTQLLEMAAKQGRVEKESWRVKKDGTTFWADVMITAVRDTEDGGLLGYAKVTRDITVKRLAKDSIAALEKVNNDIEAEERAKQSIIAAAEDCTRLKSEFLANMAHEIRYVIMHYSCSLRCQMLCLDCGVVILKHVVDRISSLQSCAF